MVHLNDRRHAFADGPLHDAVRAANGEVVYRAFHLDGQGTVELRRDGGLLSAFQGPDRRARFRLSDENGDGLVLLDMSSEASGNWRLVCAVLEYLFATSPACGHLTFYGAGWQAAIGELRDNGVHVQIDRASGQLIVFADMFWQTAALWTRPVSTHFPRHDVHDGKVSHPLRPPKPQETVYARHIPWLEGVFSLDVADIDDLPDVHRWMNDPRVNEFWHEAGDENRHGRYLQTMFDDPHIIPLIGRFNGKAFSYFEVYWAKEDVVGTFCDAADYDRGCHVIVGDEACRGRDWFTAWLPSLLHFMFLDDPRTERIVQEPSSNHHRQLRNLQKSGFSHVKSVDLPGKHAAIMTIGRQKFFADRLWHPTAG